MGPYHRAKPDRRHSRRRGRASAELRRQQRGLEFAGLHREAGALCRRSKVTMRANPVKRKLAQGGVSIGTMMFEFDSPGIGRVAALAGAEFVIFDMEHSGWSDETVKNLIATTRSSDTVPMVRVPSTQYHLLSRPLDVGAMGLMVPMVEDEAQARA